MQAHDAGKLLASAYPPFTFTRVVASPLNRAQHTLSLVRESSQLPAQQVMHDLREVDLWGWEVSSSR